MRIANEHRTLQCLDNIAYFLLVNVRVLVESVRHYKRSRLSAVMEDGEDDHLNVDSSADSYNHWNPKNFF